MKMLIAWALAFSTAALTYDGVLTHKQLTNLETRVAELEDRITIADESARQIQRMALETVNEFKRKKGEACRKKKEMSL